MTKSIEAHIIEGINKVELTIDEGVDLIEDLYWADWDLLDAQEGLVDKIFHYLKRDNLSDQETAKILKLYNNPHGAHIDKFADLILIIYSRDKMRFLKSLYLESEEAINLVYIFRMRDVKIDEDKEFLDAISSDKLSQEEREAGSDLLKMYENICNT